MYDIRRRARQAAVSGHYRFRVVARIDHAAHVLIRRWGRSR